MAKHMYLSIFSHRISFIQDNNLIRRAWIATKEYKKHKLLQLQKIAQAKSLVSD